MERVLIAEDSRTQAAQLQAILEDAGLEVLVATDGERALALLERERVDLVVSDIVMPGITGYELCRRIKSSTRSRVLPVILLSTLSEPMDIIRGLECGADNFLTKPYKPEQLVDRVRTILTNRQLRRESAVIGVEIMFLGKRFTINSEKEQILDLLISTFEDTVQANRELQRNRAELAAAKLKLEEYARALEGRVRVSEEKYALLVEQANSAIFVTDADARILEANREAGRILGLPVEEIVNRRLDEFVRTPQEGAFRGVWSRVIAEGAARLEDARVTLADTSEGFISMTAARVRVGDVDNVTVIWNDLTERTRLEEQLRHAQRIEAMGQLTGGLAHDFNNLLGVMIGNLDAIRARNPAGVAEFTDNALEAAERGAKLIRQLLAFARRQPLEPERIDVCDRLRTTARLLQSTLGAKIKVSLRTDPDTLPIVADVSQLENAILNLAVNARDAMKEGGDEIVIECDNVEVDEAYASANAGLATGEYVLIAVSDNGCGMTPQVAAKVFDPFFTTKGAAGTGLGLSQVFGFVKQSGGNVKIYSEVGVGTTVRLYLPVAADVRDAPQREARETAKPTTLGGNERILLVEDNDGMREIAETQLRALGYSVITASGAAEALGILRSREPIDLLLTDIVMPGGLDGRELALRAIEVRPTIKVLFTSGFTEAAVAASIQREFGSAMLSKPYRHADLAQRLRAILAGAGR